MKNSELQYVEDVGGGYHIYNQRIRLYHFLGFTDSQISQICKRFKYDDYIEHILTCESDYELFEKFPESWKYMRDTLTEATKRRHGRTVFATAKDILIDGMITDIILAGLNKHFPDLNIKKNGQDEKLSLMPKVDITPDFVVDGYPIEMKITTDKINEGRHQWTGTSLTIRRDDLDTELFRYNRFNTPEHPVIFLRIKNGNPTYQLAVIEYHKFVPSKIQKDGSYYAMYKPKVFNSYMEMLKLIYEEINKEIAFIKNNSRW